jgi:hypothetical protein
VQVRYGSLAATSARASGVRFTLESCREDRDTPSPNSTQLSLPIGQR